ncbi:MAG: rod shape-determining protein, partial [Cyanobacteria bacterium]|nr:rod shape-determining protein [Cyanobacteriota bacterium]
MSNFIESLKKINLPFFSSFDVCFDLGTSNTRIAVKGKGKVLNEPSYISLNTISKDYIFFGREAKTIVGKTPEFVKIIRPVVSGVISDFDAEVALLKNFVTKSIYPYFKGFPFLKPQLRAIAATPYISTEIEQKAVEEVLAKIGFSSVFLVEKPIATAFGVGVNVFITIPNLIADLGGGLIEMAITSGGGIVSEKTLKTAGDMMNNTVANYTYLKYGIILGESTCEQLKIRLLNFKDSKKCMNAASRHSFRARTTQVSNLLRSPS